MGVESSICHLPLSERQWTVVGVPQPSIRIEDMDPLEAYMLGFREGSEHERRHG